MRRWSPILVLPACALVNLLVGCASPPSAELDEAQTQLAAAEQAQAADYAADVYGEAKKLLADAEAEVERQKQAFGPGRSYGAAREMAVKAAEKARQAADNANRMKVMVEEQASDYQADLASGLAASREIADRLEKCQRRSWRSRVDLAAARQQLDDLGERLVEIQGHSEAGKSKAAMETAQPAVTEIGLLQATLEEAAASAGC